MPGVYDRFNKDLSNGIRAVDAREKMIANEQQQQSLWIQQQAKAHRELKIIRTELLEMVKIMEMHQEGMEAEKAKWRQIYYSTLKEEEVVNEEEEESLKDTELESDDDEESLEVTELESKPMMEPQLPPSLLPAPPLSPPVLTPPPSSDNEELSSEVEYSESESESTLQLPQPMLPPTEPTPPTSPPPLAPPSPRPLGCENRKMEMPLLSGNNAKGWILEEKMYFTFDQLQNDDKMKVVTMSLESHALFWLEWKHRRCPIRDWEELKGLLRRQFQSSEAGGERCSTFYPVGTQTRVKRSLLEKTVTLKQVTEEVGLGYHEIGLNRDKWATINFCGPYHVNRTIGLLG
ncbi:unnamed protein product [Lactuca virosa]|uniref:Retrotransposon gag domain-containing protein n=1 Tax=Lactuca virosa TaxID=75947 RepID=A0AAU9N2D4_9ASTR|nr:unnamed protein product [Lactuca virosa]